MPAHFVQMVALFALFRGVTAVEPLLGVVSALVGIAILCFAVNVWKQTAAQPQARGAVAPA